VSLLRSFSANFATVNGALAGKLKGEMKYLTNVWAALADRRTALAC
jgi:hypothetical protein